MNSKGRLIVSATKSLIRIGSCIISGITRSVKILCIGFVFAEILGIAEELVDKR